MNGWKIGVIIVATLTALFVWIAAVRGGKPVHQVTRSAFSGLGALGLVHLLGAFSGIGLGVGWFTGGTAFLLGVPGVITLLLLNLILQ